MADRMPGGARLTPARSAARTGASTGGGHERSEMSDTRPAGPSLLTQGGRERERKSVRMSVRLAGSERAAVARRARTLGVTPSAWVRAVVRDALDARRSEVEQMHRAASATTATVPPEVGRAVEQLRGVGRNLNQALRLVHSGEAAGIDAEVLAEVAAAVSDLRAALGDGTAL